MIIKFEDGSFISIEKEKDSEDFSLVLCGQKPDGSTTMSYVKLNKDQLAKVKAQIDEWLAS